MFITSRSIERHLIRMTFSSSSRIKPLNPKFQNLTREFVYRKKIGISKISKKKENPSFLQFSFFGFRYIELAALSIDQR